MMILSFDNKPESATITGFSRLNFAAIFSTKGTSVCLHKCFQATHGLICLKGGDLTQEIHESGLRPKIWEISKIFEEDFFKEKYILSIP